MTKCELCGRRVKKYETCRCAKAQKARIAAAKEQLDRMHRVNVYLLTFDPSCITGDVPGEDVRMLGVFSTMEKAQAVINRYNTHVGAPKDGFTVKCFPLDKEIEP